MNKLKLIFSAAIFSMLSASIFAVEVGEVAPSVTLATLSNSSEKSLVIGGDSGKVIYVDFWASWCGPCQKSFPSLDALYKKHSEAGFVLVGINLDENVDDAKAFLTQYPVSFPILTDPNGESAESFDIKGMPSGYLLDKKGVVRHVVVGFTDEEIADLEKRIVQLSAE